MSEDNVKPEEAEISAQAEGEESFRPFDEMAESFQPSKILRVAGDDGLPVLTAPEATGESDIPPLSPETLVCMEDRSKFVIARRGVDMQVFTPDEVQPLGAGRWGVAVERVAVHVIQELYGVTGKPPRYLPVRPIRPICKYYVRQIAQFEHNPEAKVVLRLCSARRTTEGAFMSVRDTAIWACTMREPRDFESEKLIDKFDEEKVLEGRRRVHLSIFNQGS